MARHITNARHLFEILLRELRQLSSEHPKYPRVAYDTGVDPVAGAIDINRERIVIREK